MKTIVILAVLLLSFLQLQVFARTMHKGNGVPHVKFLTIDYPAVILIKPGFKYNDFDYKLEYTYHGEDIITNDGLYGNYDFSMEHICSGNIYYRDQKGKPYPGAVDHFRKHGFDEFQTFEEVSGIRALKTVLKNRETYSCKLRFFSPFILKKSELTRAIKNKQLSAITVEIKELNIK
ncbi:MAG: hypothetical protein GY757_54285, partial [bacterium]|nr:hypothetical protein [bacterium]